MKLDASMFERGSSPIDWCEPNYVVSSYIAEFFNTVSNIGLLSFPFILTVLFQQYSRHVTAYCHFVFFLLLLVGVGSTYFHATLSLAGQLADEICILWVIMAAIGVWLPPRYLPEQCVRHRILFSMPLMFLALIITYLSVIQPELNAVALLCLSFPIVTIAVLELKRSTNSGVIRLGYRSLGIFSAAVTVWILDRVTCQTWLDLGFPYLHSLWHLLVAISVSQFFVVIASIHLTATSPNLVPIVRYWPSRDTEGVGVPYIDIKVCLTGMDV